jgi:hypothetical protein
MAIKNTGVAEEYGASPIHVAKHPYLRQKNSAELQTRECFFAPSSPAKALFNNCTLVISG